MKWLMRGLLALGMIWGGLWFVVAHYIKGAVAEGLAAQEAQGLVAESAGISVQGWPYRFDLTLDQPHVAQTGWDWQAPFVQVLAMAWKPWHLIAVLPGGQKLTLPDQVLTLDTPRVEASLRMAPETALPPREARVEWPSLTLTSSQGWSVATGHVLGAAQETPDQALKLWLQVDDLTLPAGSDLGGLGPKIANLRFDARLPLAAPLTWEGAAAIQGVEVRTLDLAWGSLDLEGSGRLVADGNGQAEGRIDLNVKGWQAIPDAAIGLGLIAPGMRGGLAGALEGLAEAGADPAVLALPLVMQGGQMMLGPIPLGAAPYLQ